MATNTNRKGKVAVTDAKKSQANHSFRVVAHEGGPSQAAGCAEGPGGVEIFCNRSRRDTNAELERELAGDTLFAPSWVLLRHPPYYLAEDSRQRRAAGTARFPSPENFESRATLLEEGLRLDLSFADHGQCSPPIEEAVQGNRSQAGRRGSPSWFRFAFLKQSQLPAEEKILRDQSGAVGKTTVEGR
jgi:hypothetical protein